MASDVPPPLPDWARSGTNEPASSGTPWPFWPTIGFSLAIAVAYVIAQTVGALAWILIAGMPLSSLSHDAKELTHNGGVVAYATLLSAIVAVALCVLFARLRPGISLRDYFALRWPPNRVAIYWCAGFLLYLLGCALASRFLDTSATEEFARAIQDVRGLTKVLLWIALYVGAPVTEEFFFRGFLFVGIQRSRLGPVGAIIITTVLFAAIHVQYDLQGIVMVSAASVFFGAVRHKTNSLLLCMVLHSIMNVIATVSQS